MSSSKIFLIRVVFLLSVFSLFPDVYIKYFRSNSNGLNLVEINYNKRKDYKYYSKVFLNSGLMTRKILYKDDGEYKRWDYKYSKGNLFFEEYFKDNLIKEDYRYDSLSHIVKKNEYKNGKILRTYNYQYNSDGLVDIEKVHSAISNTDIIVKYKYDFNFTIKQIEKKYPDSRIVYWETFFNSKGIVQKEYYTLKDERFTFLYNEVGQEISGEVRDTKEDKLKKEWKTYYTPKGKLERKEESNYLLGKKVFTWFNEKNKETKIEIQKNDKVETIEYFEYNADNKVVSYEFIKGLNSEKEFYEYEKEKNDKIKKITFVENGILKKETLFNEDGTKTEILHGGKNLQIIIKYDKDGKKVSEELF